MPDSSPSADGPDLATLVGDIVRDAGKLVGQQIELARAEVGGEVRRAAGAGLAVAGGGGLVAAGGVLGGLAAVHLVHKAIGIPLWVCYGLAGGAAAVAGVKLVRAGQRDLAGVRLLSPPETTKAIEENLAWLGGQTTPASG